MSALGDIGGGLLPPIIVDIIARSTGFEKGIEDSKAQMGELSAAADESAAATDGALAESDASLAEHEANVKNTVGNIAGDLGAVPIAAEDAAHRTEAATEDTSHATENMADDIEEHTSRSGGAFKRMGTIIGDGLNDLGVPIAATQGKLAGVGEAAEGAETGLGGLALGAAAVVAAIGAASVDLGIHMEDADAKIAAATGISVDAAKRIGAAFLDLGGKTEFSGETLANAYATVAGELKNTEGATLNAAQAQRVMAAASNLAVGTQTDLGSATQAVAGIMQAFGLKTAAAAHVSDVLYSASEATGTSVSGLAGQLEKARAKMGDLAPTVGGLSALLVDLAHAGITGRPAMSVLNSALTALGKTSTTVQTAIQNQKDAFDQLSPAGRALATQYANGAISAKQLTTATQALPASQAALVTQFTSASAAVQKAEGAYKNLGITVFNQSGAFVGLGSVIAQLHPKFADMTQAQQLAAATTLFGASAARQMTEIIKAGPEAFDAASASVNKLGAAQHAAGTEQHSLGGEFKVFMAALEDIGTQIGLTVLPALTSLAQTALPLVIDGLKLVVGAFADLAAAWRFLAPLHDAIGRVALVIAGIIFPIVQVIEYFGRFKAAAKDTFDTVLSVARTTWDWIKGAWPLLEGILLAPIIGPGKLIVGAFHDVLTEAQTVWNWVKRAWPVLEGVLVAPFVLAEKIIAGIWRTIVAGVQSAVHEIEKLIGDVLGPIESVVHAVGSVFGGNASTAHVGAAAGRFGPIGATTGSTTPAHAPAGVTNNIGNQHGLHIDNVIVNNGGKDADEKELTNQIWLKLRPYLTAAPY